jgi:hypothetical protein
LTQPRQAKSFFQKTKVISSEIQIIFAEQKRKPDDVAQEMFSRATEQGGVTPSNRHTLGGDARFAGTGYTVGGAVQWNISPIVVLFYFKKQKNQSI